MSRNILIVRVLLFAFLGVFTVGIWVEAQVAPKDATEETKNANAAVLQRLPFSDKTDFENANKGFIATLPDLTIKDENVNIVYTLVPYSFLQGAEAPATVNPSLWRQAQLNMTNGPFKVTDRIYQIRGFDLSNMSIIEGDTGLIIVDPLISTETAKAGLDLYYQHRPKKPVVAVIYTHSHVDHYGGVKGVVNEADVNGGKVKILAPDGFLEEAVSENVYAGNAMSRRAIYMYGALLPKGVDGQVDGGLGKTGSMGTVTLIPPTDLIKTTGEKRTVDGVEMEFQMAPGTEAPAEMLTYFPQFKALLAAEDATHTLHNLYTLRGAQVRDASKWWKTLNETIKLYGPRTEVVFASHHWPTWGNENVIPYLKSQRDLYKYIHDQSLRLLNSGYTMTEIGEMMTLPANLDQKWYNRGYYGTVNHDSKAVYQRYLGWYDSNPANLWALPPEEAAKMYVEYMGGADAVIKKAKESFAAGDYRWVAMVMNNVVFADPDNKEARDLQADALEQLGYQAESGPWRNEYLVGAYELRNGLPDVAGTQTASPDTIRAMTMEMLLDYMGMRIDGPKAAGKSIKMNWVLPDTSQKYAVELENSVLIYSAGEQLSDADGTLTLPRASMDNIMLGQTTLAKEIENGNAKVDGSQEKLNELLGLIVDFPFWFNIVTP
ncbi:MAG: MBL fold metallo-hydrolase [Candidatus Dadabacteria bacterium]|nr:MAG: MBL fold metallo-hydrolase [Candidatus Dadabacteria bacterium]